MAACGPCVPGQVAVAGGGWPYCWDGMRVAARMCNTNEAACGYGIEAYLGNYHVWAGTLICMEHGQAVTTAW